MMDDLDKYSTLQWYEDLEQQLLDFIRYVPYSPHNLNAHSPRLASIIVSACGLIDSILREITPDPSQVAKQKSQRDLDIVNYARLYAPRFGLPTLKSILLFTPPKYLVPFGIWERFVSGRVPWTSFQSPQWWSIHNDLKHNWIPNVKKAGLEIAVESLCALHQIISSVPEFARMMLRKGWVPGTKSDPENTIQVLEGKMQSMSAVLVETQLFVVARGGKEPFPEQIDDFRPVNFGASERLIDFFGRW
jgi:hypothetical protein